MRLIDLLEEVPLRAVEGPLEIACKGLSFDSRRIRPGMAFIALRGTQVDGHKFIENAVKLGATALIVDRPVRLEKQKAVTVVQTENTAVALGHMAARWYDHPSRKLELVGVTGTNGKTTVVTLLYQLFEALGYRVGMLSTVENRIAGAIEAATHTTPDPLATNALLARMVDAGCGYAFMEVSSHAIAQERIAGLTFRGGVFTNLSHDHLDYHGTFRAYLEAKKKFFDELPGSAFALTNLDDRNGRVMVQNTRGRVHTYGIRRLVDFRAKVLENSMAGMQLEVDGQEVYARLLGQFNAYNLLAAYGVARLLKQSKEEVLRGLSAVPGPAGRLERVVDVKGERYGLVDYAHTPDALEKVLATLLPLREKNARLLLVVGCGGDRDRAKRPKMAATACRADRVVLTSDNPRGEDPMQILEEMSQGIPAEAAGRVLVNPDRRQAIRTAAGLAGKGDIILVAGKGHETYQEIKGSRLPFDDRAELRSAFAELAAAAKN